MWKRCFCTNEVKKCLCTPPGREEEEEAEEEENVQG